MIPLSDMDRPGLRFPIVNVTFVLINIAVFVYQMTLSGTPLRGGLTDPCLQTMRELGARLTELDRFICTYAVVPSEIVRGQDMFTLLSAMFLHGGILHILSNMVYLWVFGDNVERGMGSLLYALFYLVGGIVASYAQIFTTGASNIPNIGASGAVAAVLGAYLVWFPGRQVRVLLILGVFMTITRVSALLLLGGWAVMQLLSGIATLAPTAQTGGGVAFWAHIGGFAFGALAGLALRGLGARRRAG